MRLGIELKTRDHGPARFTEHGREVERAEDENVADDPAAEISCLANPDDIAVNSEPRIGIAIVDYASTIDK